MHKMISHIEQSNGPVYVYSQFRDAEGVGVFAKVLEANGYLPYGYGDDNYTGTIMEPLPHSKDSVTGKMWANISPKETNFFLSILTFFSSIFFSISCSFKFSNSILSNLEENDLGSRSKVSVSPTRFN